MTELISYVLRLRRHERKQIENRRFAGGGGGATTDATSDID